MKIKNIFAATAITAWSGMACAGFVTTFGHTSNGGGFPLTTYSAAAGARTTFAGGGTPSFYNFEDATVGATSLSIGLGGVTATLSGAGKVGTTPAGTTDGFGRYSVSGVSCPAIGPKPPACLDVGTKYWEATAPVASASSFRLDFSTAVDSFGFFGMDIGDFGGVVQLVLTRVDNTTVTVAPGAGAITGGQASGSVLFFGVRADIASDYFKSVQFISSGGTAADGFAFDMFTVSAAPTAPVPLPGSLALVGAALGGLVLVRRRR